MLRYLSLLPLLLAATPPQPKPLTLAAARTLLAGTWQSTTVADNLIIISSDRIRQKNVEQMDGNYDYNDPLVVQYYSCNSKKSSGHQTGNIFLVTKPCCYRLTSLTNTEMVLTIEPGNNFTYRRVASAGK